MSKTRICILYKDHSIIETNTCKLCKGEGYNYFFDKRSGMFARWGKKTSDDPQFSPVGPEILDLEISSGRCQGNCAFCLPEEALIDTPDGLRKIEDIIDGDKVFGFDFSTGNAREEVVVFTSSKDYNGQLVIIELEDGRIVELTEDHKVMTKDGREILAGDLSLEDNVVIL